MALVAGGLAACAYEGDLGRPTRHAVHAALSEPALSFDGAEGGVVRKSRFRLTPDETEMRETAFRLRAQIHNLRPIATKANAETNYAEYLRRAGYLYGPSRLAKIDEDLRADHEALNRFATFAHRVLAADRQRLGAVVQGEPYYTVGDKRSARARVKENAAVVEGTFLDIARRIAAYDYAIDRARIETPAISTAVVNDALDRLRDRAALQHFELSRAYEQLLASVGREPMPRQEQQGQASPVDIRPPVARKGGPYK